MIEAGNSQVVTYTPAGTQPRWLGAIGHVEQLQYSWANPGGPDQLSLTLQLPPDYRTDALNPGRQCKVYRGGAVVWDGKLLEAFPDPAGSGWLVSAAGIGTAGTDFMAYFVSTWASAGNQNNAVNYAISRGLRWVNPGGNLSGPPWTSGSIPSGVWFGQNTDQASITITDLLNLFCTKGSLTWYVSAGTYGNTLSVYTIPAATLANVNRVLVSSTPVSRTLGGDYDYLWLRYQNNNSTTAAPTYGITHVSNAADITAHGQVESYDDLSSSGFQSVGTIQAAGTSVLNRYQRASFAGPFQIRPGELLTPGGAPCDLGIDHCSTVVRLILADFGYGGEVVPDPVIFLVGAYAWDETAQTAQVTPFQSLDLSLPGMLSALNTTMPTRPVPKPKKPRPNGPTPLKRWHKHHHHPRRFPGTPR